MTNRLRGKVRHAGFATYLRTGRYVVTPTRASIGTKFNPGTIVRTASSPLRVAGGILDKDLERLPPSTDMRGLPRRKRRAADMSEIIPVLLVAAVAAVAQAVAGSNPNWTTPKTTRSTP